MVNKTRVLLVLASILLSLTAGQQIKLLVEGNEPVTVSVDGTSIEIAFTNNTQPFVVKRSSNDLDTVQVQIKIENVIHTLEVIGANQTVSNEIKTTDIFLSTFCETLDQTIIVKVVIPGLPTFQYKAVCGELETEKPLRDLSSMFALMFIAIAANYIIIKHVPALDAIESLPEEQ